MFRIFNQKKQVKIQWLHDPNKSNVYNLNNIRSEAGRYYRVKKEGISEG
jgi:hypothetical protein